ncbi:MAG: PGPGW domain-containing protein [Candidatus Acidiferrales bacterium]
MPLVFLKTIEQTRRYLRIFGGFALLALGVVLLVGPGPGCLVILLGLGLLAVDFVWARRLLDRMKHEGVRLRNFILRWHPRGA